MRYRRIYSFILLFIFTSCSSASSPKLEKTEASPIIEETSVAPIEWADQKLKASGISENFIRLIHKKYLDRNPKWEDSASSIIELNVFGFLYHSNYSLHDTPLAQKKARLFLKNHKVSFEKAWKAYHVAPQAIASLIWVETRYGKNMGTFDLPWVFYSLILGSHPKFVHRMLTLLPEKATADRMKDLTLDSAKNKVVERCRGKALWAIDELKALQQIKAEHDFNPFKVKASFAGAFGIPQFIPSTYLKNSVSEFRKTADLFKPSDAIMSVGHFLNENGWNAPTPDAQVKALYAYNHSKDYGAVILKISESLEKR